MANSCESWSLCDNAPPLQVDPRLSLHSEMEYDQQVLKRNQWLAYQGFFGLLQQCLNQQSRATRSTCPFEAKHQKIWNERLEENEIIFWTCTGWYCLTYFQAHQSNLHITFTIQPSTIIQVTKPCTQHQSSKWSWCYWPKFCKSTCYGWWKNECSHLC